MPLATSWTNLEDFMLSEICQLLNKYCMVLLIRDASIRQTHKSREYNSGNWGRG